MLGKGIGYLVLLLFLGTESSARLTNQQGKLRDFTILFESILR